MTDLVKKTTLRLNISCSSRDKKFLVLGEIDTTLSQFFDIIKQTFYKLYPGEGHLKISGVKNLEGFDIFTGYKIGDVFEDNACLSITENLDSSSEIVGNGSKTKSVSHEDLEVDEEPQIDEDLKDEKLESKKKKEEEEIHETKRTHSESTDEDAKAKKPRHKNPRKKKSSK